MRKLLTLLSCSGLLLFLTPLSGYGQCNNAITFTYPQGSGIATNSIPNGQSGIESTFCPVAGAEYVIQGESDSPADLTWVRVTSRGTNLNDPADDTGVQTISFSDNAAPNTKLQLTIPPFTETVIYRFQANSTPGAYTGPNACNGNSGKNTYGYLTLTPSLTLVPNISVSGLGICPGSSVTLTASGASDGVYTWTAPGQVTVVTNSASTTAPRPSSLTVTPTATTTYTVTATTSCGTSSQQILVPVKSLTARPGSNRVCFGQTTTLDAFYTGDAAGISYKWYDADDVNQTSLGTARTFTPPAVAGTTGEIIKKYTAQVQTADCGQLESTAVITSSGTVAPVTVTPSAATICTGSGSSVVLIASSENANVTYTWSPSTGLNTTTGASVTANPSATTTYTVTATTVCGSSTATATVTVLQTPTFSIAPASQTICAGQSTTIEAVTNVSGATFQWFQGPNFSTVISRSQILNLPPTPTATTTTTTYREVPHEAVDITTR